MRASVFENVTGILQLLQILFVNRIALALKIRAEITANMRTFVPVQPEPMQAVINRGRSFLGVARFIRILDAENKCPAVMAREEPVEKRRARAADMQVTSRRWSKTNTNSGIHTIIL